MVGVGHMVERARALGLRSLSQDPSRYGLSLTLGGVEVTLLDLVDSFHTLANEGRFVEPKAILSMTDNRGAPMQTTFPDPVTVISPAAAFQITDMLSDDAARAPTFRAGGALTLSRPAAAKTGTTDDWRDNWTVGYTRYLVAGVWAGNTDGHPTQDSSGVLGAAPIWHDFMEAVLADSDFLALLDAPAGEESWQWQPPAGVQQEEACPPRLTCRSGGDYFSDGWLAEMGDAGPIADSVLYCNGNTVLRLPNMARLPAQKMPSNEDAQNGANPKAAQLAQKATDDAIAWSRQNGIPLAKNGCDDPLGD
jgi:membrane peptidoglycan carboxypeptidase